MVTLKKLSRMIREYAKPFKEDRAIFLHIAPTRRCNLRCDYCYQYDDKSPEMSLQTFNSTITNLRKLGVTVVGFTGGEPLLWSSLEDAIHYCSHEHLVTQLTTNGTLLTRQFADRLLSSGLDYLIVSADSLNRQMISKKSINRNNGLLNILKYVKSKGMLASINTVLTRENYRDVYQLIELSKHENIPISIGPIVPPPSDPNSWDDDEITFKLPRDEQSLDNIVARIESYKDQNFPIVEPKRFFGDFIAHLNGSCKWDCNLARSRSIQVSSNNKVYLCSKLNLESQYQADTISKKELVQLREKLARLTIKCNAHCYSNCAYNGYYYQEHKAEFLSHFALPILKPVLPF